MRDDEYYQQRRVHYQNPEVVQTYDQSRFGQGKGRARNRLVLDAVNRALDCAAGLGHPPQSVLDLPCGTGRLIPLMQERRASYVGSDISWEMMGEAFKRMSDLDGSTRPFVRCDAERLPFEEATFDAVVSLRFMFHLPPEVRVKILREMGRVSRRWVMFDARTRYSVNFLWRSVRRLWGRPLDSDYFTRAVIERDAQAAGLRVVKIFPARPYLSDWWIVLAEKVSVSS